LAQRVGRHEHRDEVASGPYGEPERVVDSPDPAVHGDGDVALRLGPAAPFPTTSTGRNDDLTSTSSYTERHATIEPVFAHTKFTGRSTASAVAEDPPAGRSGG
jgi:hypothetical protein